MEYLKIRMVLDENIIAQKFPITIPIRIWVKNGMPCIELRKCIQLNKNSEINNETLKIIIQSAFRKKPLIILPSFSDDIKGIASLVENGLIYYNKETQQYHFNF